ncbi:hypothetical protein AHAS_Ahas16G0076700 [Arachis hypogaea]
MWDLTIHPPKGAQRPRWHIDSGSGSDTICNSPDHPLARYCPLWYTRPHGFAFDDRDDSRNPPHSLVKTRHARERYPHPSSNIVVAAYMETEAITEHWFKEEVEGSDQSGGQCDHGDDRAEEEGDGNDDDGS